MSRWHREHPDYQETGMQPPDPRDAWDMERKRQKEEGDEGKSSYQPCRVCGETMTLGFKPCRRCQASIEEDRLNRGE